MKHFFLYILLGTLLTGGIMGCRKDTVTISDYTSSLSEIDELFARVPASSSVTTFELQPGGIVIPDTVLTTASGVRVFLVDTEHLFATETGAPQSLAACNKVKIQLTEVFKKGELIARALPTINAEGKCMESSGSFYLSVTCDGRTVRLLNDRYIKIQYPASAQLEGMNLFYPPPGNDNTVPYWDAGPSNSVFLADWQGQQGLVKGYELLTTQLGWVSAMRAVSTDTGNFCATFPLPFDGENTRVYLIFSEQRTVKPLQFVENGKFCATDIPLGYPVRLIAVSIAGPQHWLVQVETESASDASLNVQPDTKSEIQILDFIRGL